MAVLIELVLNKTTFQPDKHKQKPSAEDGFPGPVPPRSPPTPIPLGPEHHFYLGRP